MFKATALLTLATIAGLILGFGREWLIIDHWGMRANTDALLVAMFLPEALRTMLGGGLMSAAALPLWSKQPPEQAKAWLSAQIAFFLLVSIGLSVLLSVLAPAVIRLIGLGLNPAQISLGSQLFTILVWALPGILLQSLLAVPMQADHRYTLAGLASFLFNLPPVAYLLLFKTASFQHLCMAYVLGSLLMALALIPYALQHGLLRHCRLDWPASRQLLSQLGPLLTSSLASQGLTLIERMAASLLGEGAITLVNFARKLSNLPLIALMSLNQVLLSKMSQALHEHRQQMLTVGLLLTTLLTLPASLAMIAAAPTITEFTMPAGQDFLALSVLLACYAPSLLFGSWNALLARYFYALGDTRTPLRYELLGSAFQAMLMLLLSRWLGINGLAFAVLGGVILTAILLVYRVDKGLYRQLAMQSAVSMGLMLFSYWVLFPLYVQVGWLLQILAACVLTVIVMLSYFLLIRKRMLLLASPSGLEPETSP